MFLDSLNFPKSLNSPEKRILWWNKLSEKWRNTFLRTLLNKNSNSHQITDSDLGSIVTAPVIRLVGPGGPNPNIDFSIEDLSGLSELTELEVVIAMSCRLMSLKGIEKLNKIKSLFINDNELKSIAEIRNLPDLRELYCSNNLITSIQPVSTNKHLHTFYINNNRITSLKGISKFHRYSLKNFYCLPNDELHAKEIRRVENEIGILCR